MLRGEEGNTPECVVMSGRTLMEKKGFHRRWKAGRGLESARRWHFRYFGFRIKIGPWELNWTLGSHLTVSSNLWLWLWCENVDSEWILVITYLSNQINSSPAGEMSSGRWNRKSRVSCPWLFGLFQSCRNGDRLDWQSFCGSQWPGNYS